MRAHSPYRAGLGYTGSVSPRMPSRERGAPISSLPIRERSSSPVRSVGRRRT